MATSASGTMLSAGTERERLSKGGIEMKEIQTATIEEPRFARVLFASKGAAWLWLVAGWDKVTGTQATGFFNWRLHFGFTEQSWLRDGGTGLKGFAAGAIANSQGEHAAVSYGWYVSFLKWIESSGHGFLAPMIAIGELAIGVALIAGLFVGIAALFGAVLNVSFGLAGVAGVNPLFFLVGVLLILAWRNAGYYGLDRYVLPALGTPWQPGRVFRGHQKALPAVA
jgi:thiosulfate dehydrogenase [quinone] large subunit